MLCFSFLPTLIVLKMGQIAPVILLGAVAFLACERRRWDWLAGAAATLVVIKPHLTYLFAPALLLWAVERRRWSVLTSAVVTGLVCIALPLALDPHMPEALLNMGRILETTGKSDEARACWTKALEAEPALAQGYFGPAIE